MHLHIGICLLMVTCISLIASSVFAVDGSGTNTVAPNTAIASSTGNTHTFTYTAAELMDSGEISVTAPAGWSAPQGSAGTVGFTTASATGGAIIANVVNALNSTTNWAATQHMTLSTDTGDKQEGTASLVNTISATAGANEQWYVNNGAAQNWGTIEDGINQRVGMWVKSSVATAAGDLSWQDDNSTNLASPLDTINVPALVANTWTYTSVTLGAATRPSVSSYGYRYTNDIGPAVVKVDSVGPIFDAAGGDNWTGDSNITVSTLGGAADHKEGSLAIRCTYAGAAGTGTNGECFRTSGTTGTMGPGTTLAVWVRPSVALSAGDFAWVDDGSTNLSSPEDVVSLPALAANTWAYITLNVPNSANKVASSWGFRQVVDKGSMTFDLDAMTKQVASADSTAPWTAPTLAVQTLATDSVVFHEGGNSLRNTITAAAVAGDKWYEALGATQNWSGYTTVGLWIRSTVATAAGNLQFQYASSSNLSSPIASINIGALPANTWSYQKLTLTGTRTTINSYGINQATDIGAATIYLDDVLIGPGVPTFPGGGVVRVRLLQTTSPQTIVLTYGSGGGASGATAPASAGAYTFTTQSRISDSGTLTNIATSPVITVLSTPVVTGVTSSLANGSYTVGQVIPIQVTFNQTVIVTGTPQLTLETGASDAVVNYASGSGTATLTFNYTVAAGHTSADLDYISTTALALNSGTIKDATSTVNANLTLAAPAAAGSLGANKNIVIDTTAPTVTNVTSSTANGTYGTGQVISIQVVFSEVVNVTGTPQLTLETGASDAVVNYTSGTGTNTLTFNYTVAAGHASADLDYISTTALALNSGTIRDAATNNAVLTLAAPAAAGSLGANKNIVIATDTTPPTIAEVTPVPTPTNDTTPNYTFSSTEAGTITYGGDCSSATVAAFAGNNTITFNVLAPGLHNNCTITVTDAATNVSNVLNVSPFTIDTTAPTVTEVTPVPTPTNDTTPNYTFSSDEAGTITYGGDCSSVTTSAVVGNNTITFNVLAPGLHNNCTITVTDAQSNISNILNVSAFTIDTTAPIVAEVTPVPTPTGDSTPNYTFSTTEAGTITYGGDCSSATTTATSGNNTVTFNTLTDGLHNNCTITVTDAAGNVSAVLNITPFTVDTAAPTIAEVTPVSTPTNDTTPNYTFSSTEAGTITYGGDCSSATTSAVAGNNTITFNILAPGLHNNCTITVTDAQSNVSNLLNVSAFTIDTSAPVIAQVTPVPSPTNDTTPNYTFSSTEAGTITYGGDCSSITTSAASGNNTVTFNALSPGLHSNCTITVTDAAGNVSNLLNVNSFTIDTTGPTVTEVTPVPDPTGDNTPNYTFNTTEPGTITYGGDCSSATTSAVSGNNTITFNTLPDGLHSNCTITITDAAGNVSNVLNITAFTVDTAAPTIAEVTPVPTPTNDTTPNYTFSSTEAGTITYGGDCSSATTSAVAGNNTITFNVLSPGLHNNCTILVTDTQSNPSNLLNVSAFTIDTSAPTVTEVTPVASPTSDNTPNYTFNTTEAGTITYGGDCSSATTTATSGNNTITFNALADGTHSNCTITITDAAGNISNVLSITAFTIDTTGPVIAQVTPVPSPTNDTTPNYTFSSTEAGTITYGGDCSSATTSAVAGNNTITFNALAPGLHNNCTITVTDAQSNVSNILSVNAFTIDTTAPTVAEVTPVPPTTSDNTPNYTFSSTEAGTITYGGDCSSVTTSATSGNNTVTFNMLADGLHNNCTISVTDAAGNISNVLNISAFTVDTSAPTIAEVTPVPTPTNDTTPNYTFSSTEAGTITYGGDCSSATTSAVVGNNTITFNALAPGLHNNCTITVTDAQSNPSNLLNVTAFTIDTSAPVLTQVTPVPSPTNDNSPNYTFNSTEGGTISYGGDCSSVTTTATSGNNTITFSTLADGLHNNCTISVTDAAGNISNILSVNAFTIDTIAPVVTEVTPVPSPTGDSTPNYTFNTSEAGTITYGGDCSSATTSAVSGNNTITFNTLPDGLHSNCTITITDGAGNVSAVLNITPFTVDTAAPTIAEVTPVSTPTNDTTPNYTFSSTEAGTITYGGDCSSASTSAVVGNNTVTFNALAPGLHNNCTITVTDAQSNISNLLNVSPFTIDTTAPIIAEVTPVPSTTNDTTPNYTFSSTEAGTITYGGDCSSATTTATSGNNTVTFNTLSNGLHNNCTITITDAAGNISNVLNVSPFTVDTTGPTIAEVIPVPTPTNDTTPNYTFSSTEPGTITYGGDCSSATTSATVGNNTITFNALAPGLHNNCTITVTDGVGNPSNILAVSPFTIDTTAPIVTEVTPVPSPTGDNTPNYTFNTTEGGTITYGGDCSSSTTSAVIGNNTVTFNTLPDGLHNNCTITVTDAAGNVSTVLNITPFTVDTAAPTIAEVTPVPTPTNDTTPNYTFSSTEPGTITYGGDCSSATTSAVLGNNTITFNVLTPGLHNNCTITVTDTQSNVSNVLNVSSFTIDTSAPVVTEVTPVPPLTADNTPDYTFNTTEAGTITYSGDCSSATTSATSGNNTITFNTLADGLHNNCTITVTDAAGNISNILNVSPFTVNTDVTPPTIAEVIPVPTPTNDTTPTYTFSSSEAGTITYGGDCSSATTSATSGNNTVTFNTLAQGLHSNCTITVTDAAFNVSNVLNVSPFTIDTSAPVIAEVTPVPVTTSDTTPNYTFSSTEAGTITYGGDCSSATTSATSGNNTITFNTLSNGLHNNCTIIVTDAAGNISNTLNVTPFTIVSVDTTPPTIAEVIAVPDPTNDTTPNYTFSSTEAGTITYNGDCSSATTVAVAGNNTVTFNTLSNGLHNNCTITVTDGASNVSNVLNVSPFTVDTATVGDQAAPTLIEIIPVPSPDNDPTPEYTFNTTEGGTITYSGGCTSETTVAVPGDNTITFGPLEPGTYDNCTVTVTDAFGNQSVPLHITPFIIESSNNASARNNRRRSNVPTTVGCGRDLSSPVPFIDIYTLDTLPYIENFYRRCIVDGRTGTMFMPDSSVTKGEFVKIVMNTFNLGTAEYEPAFADVGPDYPLAPYIIKAAKLGFIFGYNPGGISYFNPNTPITRAEAFKILLLAKGAQLGGYEAQFSDVKRGDWYYDFAAWAQNKGLAAGYHQVFSKDGLVRDFYSFAEQLYIKGDVNEDIGNYKEVFAQLGYFYGDINDTFDPELVGGVSAYQTIKGIKPNIGQIGAQTRVSLLNERLTPHEENWFRPNRPITRSEVVKIVYLSESL